MEVLHSFSCLAFPMFDHPHDQASVFFCSDRVSCDSVYAHCLLSCQWTPLSVALFSAFTPCQSISHILIRFYLLPSKLPPLQSIKSPTSPHMADGLVLQSFLWLAPVCLCLSCTGLSRTGHRTPSVASSFLTGSWGITSLNLLVMLFLKDAPGCLCHESTLLAPVHLFHQGLYYKTTSQLAIPHPVLVHGVVPS